MADATRTTGTRDTHYNVISVLYHTLQEGETLAQYIADAEQAGDQELARFFREVQEEDRQRADRGKALLRQRLGPAESVGGGSGRGEVCPRPLPTSSLGKP